MYCNSPLYKDDLILSDHSRLNLPYRETPCRLKTIKHVFIGLLLLLFLFCFVLFCFLLLLLLFFFFFFWGGGGGHFLCILKKEYTEKSVVSVAR